MGNRRLPPPPTRDAKLTDQQKVKASEIASRYEADAMTHEDQRSMRKAFSEAGIRPGRDLRNVLEKEGFSPRGAGRRRGGPGPDPSAVSARAEARETRARGVPEEAARVPPSDRRPPPRPERAVRPTPPPFVTDFRSKLGSGEAGSAEVEAFAEQLRSQGRSLRDNLLDAIG